ncbi:MAG TPA: hypothetical protein VIG24_14755, partial [Acidimicrobiia bacterium]
MLTYLELVELARGGVIDASMHHVGPASIDVRLGDTWMFELPRSGSVRIVDLAAGDTPDMKPITADQYTL